MKKLCCIFNYASHYRYAIFTLIDHEFKTDFYFGDKLRFSIKKMDYDKLSGFKKELKNIFFNKFYWQKGVVKTVFKKYNNYVITGDPYCVSTWVILILLLFTSKKTYLWTHGIYGKENKINLIFKKLFFKLSDGLLLYGDYAKEIMIKEGFNPNKLHCIYNSLDYDKHLEVRKNLKRTNIFTEHFKNDNPTVCYVGRIQKTKRLDLLLDALLVLEKDYNLKLNVILVGKDSEGTNIKQIVEKNNLSKQVWFYGPCYEEEKLGEIFYNSLICVSPGNVGLTSIHSLSYGCPVITHNNFKNQGPEFEVVISGVTGGFFVENDYKDLAFVIHEWFKNSIGKEDDIRNQCFNIIDEKYNPYYQINVLKTLIN